MKPLLLPGLAALAIMAGCTTISRSPLNPIRDVRYNAMGHDPFWILAIGEDRIVLTTGPEGGRADGELTSAEYPRALPRETDGVRRWESGVGTAVIAIEARREPCRSGNREFPDRVTVSLSGRQLQGCGGRERSKDIS